MTRIPYTLRRSHAEIPTQYVATDYMACRAEEADDELHPSISNHPVLHRRLGRVIWAYGDYLDTLLDLFAVDPIPGVLVHRSSVSSPALVVLSGVSSTTYDRLRELLDAAHSARAIAAR